MHAHLQGSTGFDIPLQDFHRSSKSARELVQDHWGWVNYVYTCMVSFLNGSMEKKSRRFFRKVALYLYTDLSAGFRNIFLNLHIYGLQISTPQQPRLSYLNIYIYTRKKRTSMQDETTPTTRTPASTSPVSLAAGPLASPPPKISRASSEPLFHAPEEAKANPPPLPPPDSPPSKCDEPIESDLTDEQKKLEIVNTLAQYLAACPSFLEPVKKGTYSDSGDESPVSQVPLPENKAWGFESISLSI